MVPITFVFYSHGKPVFTDDHAAVIYRLHLLIKNFPGVPVYNVMWNNGTDWRDFFATGILNVFILFYPILLWFDSLKAHVVIVPALLFVIFPLSCYFAARLHQVSKVGSLLAAYLGVFSTTLFYKWALSYGSLGFVCSIALVPLASSLMLRITEDAIYLKKIRLSHFALCAITTTLSICWSMEAVALLPLALVTAYYSLRFIIKDTALRRILFIFVTINLLWMLIFIKVSKVGSFLKAEKVSTEVSAQPDEFTTKSVKGAVSQIDFKKSVHIIQENITKANPLIFMLCVPAFLRIRCRQLKIALLLNSVWLLIIGIIGPSFKPQLELDRLLIVLVMLSIFPVAKFFDDTFLTLNTRTNAVYHSLVSSFVVISTISFSSIVQNRGSHKFYLQPRELQALASLINENTDDGRAVFSGFLLHDMGHGHLAPLAQLSTVPLVGSSPVHNLWWHTDVIPESYRSKGDEGIEEYLDLVNASVVLAHEKVWKDYFTQRSAMYTLVGRVGKFQLFKRAKHSTYFIEGEGSLISQGEQNLKLVVHSGDAVIKFNYFPFLSVSGCKSIEPYSAKSDFTFIKLTGCEISTEIEIRSVNPLKRLFL